MEALKEASLYATTLHAHLHAGPPSSGVVLTPHSQHPPCDPGVRRGDSQTGGFARHDICLPRAGIRVPLRDIPVWDTIGAGSTGLGTDCRACRPAVNGESETAERRFSPSCRQVVGSVVAIRQRYMRHRQRQQSQHRSHPYYKSKTLHLLSSPVSARYHRATPLTLCQVIMRAEAALSKQSPALAHRTLHDPQTAAKRAGTIRIFAVSTPACRTCSIRRIPHRRQSVHHWS